MSRAFDILPPYSQDEPRTYHHHEKEKGDKGKKSFRTFFVFIFSLFLIFVLYTFAKSSDLNLSTTNKPNASTNTSKNSFELFDNQGNSSLDNQTNIVSVKLQDAASAATNLSLAKDKLLAKGYEIASTEKLATQAEQTTVYYKKGAVTKAQQVVSVLAPDITAVAQESSTLENSYDLLVMIGNK